MPTESKKRQLQYKKQKQKKAMGLVLAQLTAVPWWLCSVASFGGRPFFRLFFVFYVGVIFCACVRCFAVSLVLLLFLWA